MTYRGFERPWATEVDYTPIGEPIMHAAGVLIAMYEDNTTGKIVCATISDDNSERRSYPKEVVTEYGNGDLERGIARIGRERYQACDSQVFAFYDPNFS